jgi:hypothetical protein
MVLKTEGAFLLKTDMDQNSGSWNRIAGWLRQVATLNTALGR